MFKLYLRIFYFPFDSFVCKKSLDQNWRNYSLSFIDLSIKTPCEYIIYAK